MAFSLRRSDLAEQSADALVYGARTDLAMETPIASTLLDEAGQEIAADASVKGPVKLGQAVVTDAYALDADYVIHAVAIPGHTRGQPSTASIRAAMRTALRRSDELGCTSLVTPALATDMATVAFTDAARVVCETIQQYEPASLEDVRIVVDSDHQYDFVADIADHVGSH